MCNVVLLEVLDEKIYTCKLGTSGKFPFFRLRLYGGCRFVYDANHLDNVLIGDVNEVFLL